MRLRLQVAKCGFTDPDDVIRSKILQTMRDKKLRGEAMVKRYTLQEFLPHAANKEDIACQAQDMEQKLAPDQEQVNRIHPKRTQKPKDKMQNQATARRQEVRGLPILWYRAQRAKTNLPHLWKDMWPVFKKRSFRSHVQKQKKIPGRLFIKITVNCKVCPGRGTKGIVRFGLRLPGQT